MLTSARLHGYKWMYRKCIQAGFNVKQNVVRQILNVIDPVGVAVRKRNRLRRRTYFNKGPNYLCHIDGYDKLKPYGICISGCIDGFSRKILWLKAANTNNNPKVIAKYYIETVKKLKGFPRTIRSDFGTENSYIENMQNYFSEVSTDYYEALNQLPPFLYGSSHGNQRIESWWSMLRRHNSQFWINLFETLKNDGLYNGTFIDKSIIQFCFMEIIQEELNTVAVEWNTHSIRRSRNANAPGGRPEILYQFPEIYNSDDYITSIEEIHILNCEEECCTSNILCSDEDVFHLCEIISSELNVVKPTDIYKALDLYVHLRSEIVLALNL